MRQGPHPRLGLTRQESSHSAEASTGIRILPGVEPLLRALASERRAVVALVTGNLEPIAWLKMSALGLRPHFSSPEVGGFGSDHTERGELVRLAAERAAVTCAAPQTPCCDVLDSGAV